MYRREIAVGGSVTFVGLSDSWIRIDVLAIDGDQVHIGFAWPEEYRPRGGGRCVRLGRFRVRALKFVGGGRVQLGIDIAPGFRAAPCNQPQQEQGPAQEALLGAMCPEIAGNPIPVRERREENKQGPVAARTPAGRRDRRRRQRAHPSSAGRRGGGTPAEEAAMPAPHTRVSRKAMARLLSLNDQRFQ
jgi:hypothetical protein